ncbi:MAG: DUF6538 domain-containing protein [Acetobacter sp.]|uniref:DUF6538 domain-containing protein n=1 Tax=Acetobacter sp. TaxID=440 RepID=UPI0039ED8D9F
MLALVGTHYHFRRVIPVALRPLFGKTEFWISLKNWEQIRSQPLRHGSQCPDECAI